MADSDVVTLGDMFKDQPARDRPEEQRMSDSDVTRQILQYFKEAKDAKRSRMIQNRFNREAFMEQQDFSDKQDGQSREFLPKLSTAAEQFGALVKKGLIQTGDWFSVRTPRKTFLSSEDIREILKVYLENLPEGRNKKISFAVRLSDAVKMGGLESLMVLKVGGRKFSVHEFDEEENELVVSDSKPWRLTVESVRTDDYYPDPSGRGLYEIHKVERDLSDVIELAKQGIYRKDQVAMLRTSTRREEDEVRREHERGQNESAPPGFRKKVVLYELWGDLLNEDGSVAHHNCVATLANEKFLIRRPETNPWWHQKSPILAAPIIRVPDSVWHKALYDAPAALNSAINELFNLSLDGALSAVWGVKQIRPDLLADPTQVTNGVSQGDTLVIKDGVPMDIDVMKRIDTGNVPREALALLNVLDKEFQAASLSSDFKVGQLPAKQVKATEVVAATQSQGITLDSIVGDIEDYIRQLVEMAWLDILQNADDLNSENVVEAIGPVKALRLAQMRPAERFAMFANGIKFQVRGLSTVLAKARDFQKLMAILQAGTTNPLLLQALMQELDMKLVARQLFKMVNLNIDDFKPRDGEQQQPMQERIGELQQLQQITGGGGGGGSPADGGDAGLSAEIAQEAKPTET